MMLAAAAIFLVSAAISWLEIPSLRKEGKKRDLWVFVGLLLLATGISVAKALDMKIPNPLDWIAWVYKPLSDLLLQWLK